MKKAILFVAFAALAFAAAVMMASCQTGGNCGGAPHDPDEITGTYAMNYNMYIDGEAVNAEPDGGSAILIQDGDRYTVDIHPHGYILTPIPALGRAITAITMSAVEPGGTVGDYTVEWSGEAVVSYFDGVVENVAAAATMTGSIDRKPATRCSPVIHTPDEYHNLAMTIELAIPAGDDSATRNMRIEITGR